MGTSCICTHHFLLISLRWRQCPSSNLRPIPLPVFRSFTRSQKSCPTVSSSSASPHPHINRFQSLSSQKQAFLGFSVPFTPCLLSSKDKGLLTVCIATTFSPTCPFLPGLCSQHAFAKAFALVFRDIHDGKSSGRFKVLILFEVSALMHMTTPSSGKYPLLLISIAHHSQLVLLPLSFIQLCFSFEAFERYRKFQRIIIKKNPRISNC